MSTIRIKRGLEANRLLVTPLEGELIYTTDDKHVFIGDGSTVGGIRITTTPADLLLDIKTVDGAGSGLDADLLDGINSSDFFRTDIIELLPNSFILDNGSNDSPSIIWRDQTPVAGDNQIEMDLNAGILRFLTKFEGGAVNVGAQFHLDDDNFQLTSFTANGDCSIGTTSRAGGSFANGKALAFGDSDTGIRQDGDGILEIWSQNQEIANYQIGNISLNRQTTISSSGNGTLTINSGGNDTVAFNKTGGNTETHTLIDGSNVGFRFFQNGGETMRAKGNDFHYQGFNVHTEKYNPVNIMNHLTASQSDGSANATAAFQTLIDSLAGSSSRSIYIPHGATIRIDTDITLHLGINLIGDSIAADYGFQGSIISGNGGTLICVGSNNIRGITFNKTGASTTPSALVGYVGTAIKASPGNVVTDVTINDSAIYGFNVAIDFGNNTTSAQTRGRLVFDNIKIDCTTGIIAKNLKDTCYFSKIHAWPFLGNGLTTGDLVNGINRDQFMEIGISAESADWTRITDCFCHSYANGFKFQGASKLSMVGCGYDYERYQSAIALSRGILIDGFSSAISITNCHFSGGEICAQLYMEGAVNVSNSTFENGKDGLVLSSGKITFSGCQFTISATADVPNPTWSVNCSHSTIVNNVCLVSNSYFGDINGGIAKGTNALEVKSYGNHMDNVITHHSAGVTIV